LPEIWPWDAKEAGLRVVATGRSDFPNQVNNSIGFPAIFRGTLDVKARTITDEMCIAAAYELAINSPRSRDFPMNTLSRRWPDTEVFVREAGRRRHEGRRTGRRQGKSDPRRIDKDFGRYDNGIARKTVETLNADRDYTAAAERLLKLVLEIYFEIENIVR